MTLTQKLLPPSLLREQLPETAPSKEPSDKQKRARQQHPGRNEFPAHLERVEEIIPCDAAQCTCSKCGRARKTIGYDTAEVLARKPIEYFVRVIKREKRAPTPTTKTRHWGSRPVHAAPNWVCPSRPRPCALRPSRSYPMR